MRNGLSYHDRLGRRQVRGWTVTLLVVLAVVTRCCRAQSTICLNGHIYEFDTELALNHKKATKHANSLTKCGKQVRPPAPFRARLALGRISQLPHTYHWSPSTRSLSLTGPLGNDHQPHGAAVRGTARFVDRVRGQIVDRDVQCEERSSVQVGDG
jgi:hypothetical protein